MSPFDQERPELTGSLITMEFGPGGRITQLWAADPGLPDEGEEFQFILPALGFGEESSENLCPGTILLSARTDPDDPWISSRNSEATKFIEDSESPFEDGSVSYEYDFPFLPEISATGRFYEAPGQMPQIVWELEIKNTGRKTIEIGELGFPLALNNFYDGFGWTDEQLKRLWTSRLYLHQFIGGAASYLFAQRMTSEPPGLLIFPGENTGWEFSMHVQGSLSTPHQWEGIPVVYVHSRATMDREGWNSWWNQHTSLILEPGDSRKFEMRFIPADRDKQDGVNQTLALCGRPAIKVLPSAVAPYEVGIGVEIQGVRPTRFFVTKDAETETDVDEEGGFCFVKPREPGPIRVSFEDNKGRLSHVHLMFTERIEDLIRKRAQWIQKNQVFQDPTSRLHQGILMANYESATVVTDPEEYTISSGLECALADALFLAEKNSLYPDRQEILAVDNMIGEFLQDDIQNPSNMAVASYLDTAKGGASYFGRPMAYPAVFNLYHAMYKVAKTYGEAKQRPHTYLRWAAETATAMFRFGWRNYVRTVGVLGYSQVYQILIDLQKEQMTEEYKALFSLVENKAKEMVKQEYPYAGESVLDTSGFEEVYAAAMFLDNDEHLERTLRCAFASRSLAPSWWWYGSDKRSWDGADSTPQKALLDRGEACLAHTTISNSAIFFAGLDRDYLAIPDAYMRLAFGGLIGPWALVRGDGACSMCYCPDPSSRHHGYNPFTGASGLGYFHYLRTAGAYVMPSRGGGEYMFGCHFETKEDRYVVTPWDGVGRKVVLRQIGAEFHLSFGKITRVELDLRKRWAQITVENPSDKSIKADIEMHGLWGNLLQVQGKNVQNHQGKATAVVDLDANKKTTIVVKVTR